MNSWVKMIMGLPVAIHLPATGPGTPAPPQVEQAFAHLQRADEVFSPHRADSVLNRHLRGEVLLPEAPPEFAQVLALCARATVRTDGAFDARASGTLDPSGAVKGWAAQGAAARLAARWPDYQLNAGGDVALGSSESPWQIGIEHPTDSTGLLAVLSIGNGAVATSGTAHRGAHILDPARGRAASGLVQATVVGPDLTWADIWATALCARGTRLLDPRDTLLARLEADGYQAMFVTEDADLYRTTNFTGVIGQPSDAWQSAPARGDFRGPDDPRPAKSAPRRLRELGAMDGASDEAGRGRTPP